MKYQLLRKLVQLRSWARTENGEKKIVHCLTCISLILLADAALFIYGCLMLHLIHSLYGNQTWGATRINAHLLAISSIPKYNNYGKN